MKPMLAAPTDGENLEYPLFASPKLDGVRALVINGVVMSRSLKPIPNKYVQSIFGLSKLNGFDGELIVGDATAKDVYQKTVSGVMTKEGQPAVMFKVFDDFDHPCDPGFAARFTRLHDRVVKLPTLQFNNCQILHQVNICNKDELNKWELSFLQDGYEGIMLRHPNGYYKHGRSTLKEGYLLKLKRFEDAEAIILDFYPLMHNANEAEKNELGYTERSSKKVGKVETKELGGFKVRDTKTGVEFDIGTGFSAAQRSEFFMNGRTLIGKMVKYKYQKVGVKDKPRFPVFLGFRDSIDL